MTLYSYLSSTSAPPLRCDLCDHKKTRLLTVRNNASCQVFRICKECYSPLATVPLYIIGAAQKRAPARRIIQTTAIAVSDTPITAAPQPTKSADND